MVRVPFRVMAAAAGAIAAAALALGASAATAADAPPGVVVLKAARLFDGRADAAVRDGVVLVEGGTIKAVGSGLAVPAGARVIDLGDVDPPSRLHRRPYPPHRRVLGQLALGHGVRAAAERARVRDPGHRFRAPHPHGRLHHRPRRGQQ